MMHIKTSVNLLSLVKSASLFFSQAHILKKIFKRVSEKNRQLTACAASQMEAEDKAWLEGDISNLHDWGDSSYSKEELEELQPVRFVPGKGLVVG